MSTSLAHDLAMALSLADPVDLFRRTIGEPDLWQARVLRSTCGPNPLKRKTMMVCGRMTGKSATASVIACHVALTQNNSTVLLVAPSLRQSSLLFSSVMNCYHKLTGLDDPEAESRLSVTFSNKSKIISTPGGDGGSTIRGYACDAVICDEACCVPSSPW